MRTRSLAAAVVAAAALITAAGCSNEQPQHNEFPLHEGEQGQQQGHGQHGQGQQGQQQPNRADVAPADVSFAQGMIPHHEQAVRMSEMAEQQSDNPELLALAGKIKSAQQPEIDQLNSWLRAWGAPAQPQGQHGGGQHGGSQHGGGQQGGGQQGGHEMHGMMSQEDMAKLAQARGPEFDRMWLEMMIEHHEGAVDMARKELDSGRNPDAKAMAQRIVDSQRAEIDEMKAMLNS